ncbi:MAG: trypsin-like peptidase domain-containing protein [Prevotellaceae bacterium]|jgi:hypothetical protein|nr:trypsin-like peptidase domain-containing protein [Prevotellaceae bacterium]
MDQNIHKTIYKVNHADGTGSCFYIKEHNMFVTNYHVVEGFKKMAIQDNDKNLFLANVVLVNPDLDIALLSAEGDFTNLPEIRIAKSGEVKIGQKLNVAGYPFGMPFTVTEGTVSSPKQLIKNKYYIQTDAAVNPGNSGGPMFNEDSELVAITASKITDADNMGFGIPVESLNKVLQEIGSLDKANFNVQCSSCDSLIAEQTEYCPSCGERLSENIFKEQKLTDLAQFCEKAIENMGINPILARVGYEAWKFHKGSSEIRMFVYDRSYLFCTSPINILPKKDLEPVLKYLLSGVAQPYQMGLENNQIFISYRIHISDILCEKHADDICHNITNLAFKADEMDNYLAETFGCEFSEYAKKDAI